jgi:hypothetical protein
MQLRPCARQSSADRSDPALGVAPLTYRVPRNRSLLPPCRRIGCPSPRRSAVLARQITPPAHTAPAHTEVCGGPRSHRTSPHRGLAHRGPATPGPATPGTSHTEVCSAQLTPCAAHTEVCGPATPRFVARSSHRAQLTPRFVADPDHTGPLGVVEIKLAESSLRVPTGRFADTTQLAGVVAATLSATVFGPARTSHTEVCSGRSSHRGSRQPALAGGIRRYTGRAMARSLRQPHLDAGPTRS